MALVHYYGIERNLFITEAPPSTYLIPPLERVSFPVLEAEVHTDELPHTDPPHRARNLLRLLPSQQTITFRQQTHIAGATTS